MPAILISLLITLPAIMSSICAYVYLRRRPLSPVRERLSKLVFTAACGTVAVAILVTLWLAYVVVHDDGWSAIAFTWGIAPLLTVASLFFAVLPSALFYSGWRSKRDFMSLRMSAIAIGIFILEAVVLCFIPLHARM